MNIPSELLAMLNEQIAHEENNERVYLQLAADFDFLNLMGLSAFMKKQADGEHEHASKFREYIQDRSCKVSLMPLPEVNTPVSPNDMLITALALEQLTTKKILALAQVAGSMDVTTFNWLQWATAEQIEEERTVSELCAKFAHYPSVGFVDEYAKELAK